MKKGLRALSLTALTFLLFFAVAGTSWAATISGKVFNNLSTAGRVYIGVYNQYGGDANLGVSIPNPGSDGGQYAVRGVPPGDYEVRAFMDAQGTGTPHASDQIGSSSPVSVSNDNVTGADIQLILPDPPATVQDLFPAEGDKLQIGGVIPGPGAAMVGFDAPRNSYGFEIADAYTIYWNTQLPVGPADQLGSKTFTARNDDMGIINNLPTGQILYFAVTGTVNGVESAAATYLDDQGTPIQVTIGAIPSDPPFSHTVSGTVTVSPSITPAGPLYVAVVTENDGFFVTKVDNPGNQAPNPFSVTGVPDGAYRIYALIDQDNNGEIRDGDYMVGDSQAPAVTVDGGDVSDVAITLNNNDIEAGVATTHWRDPYGDEGYDLGFEVARAFKRPVNVTVRAGQNVSGPVDLAMRGDWGEFSYWVNDVPRPTPGTEYTLDVEYANGDTAAVPLSITAVLDSFPTPVNPKGKVTPFNATPTFSWNHPSPLPDGPFTYSLNVNSNGGGFWWDPERLPGTTTQVDFNFDGEAWGSLSDNAVYTWELGVEDLNGNQARVSTIFFSGGSISGTVTDGASNGIAGISVQLYDSNGQYLWDRWTKTTADGSYVIGGLQSGDYRVCFYGGETGYVSKCYNDLAFSPYQASLTPVTSPDDTPNIDAVLVQGATISGTVTASGAAPIAGVSVELRDENGNWIPGNNWTQTDGNGSYTLTGLAAGSYKLYFNGSSTGYIGEWYNDASDQSSAQTITLVAGQTQTADATLGQGGSITGTVTDEGTGAKIEGVRVQIFDQNGNWLSGYQEQTTDANGAYTIGGLPSGAYKVCFSSGSTNYIGECYDNVPYNTWEAPTVTVTAPDPTMVNAALVKGGTITGTVINGSAAGISQVMVEVRDANGDWIGLPSTWTSQDGSYTLGGVPTGSYKIFFNGAQTGYIGRWYDGGTGTADIGSAQTLTIAAGETKSNIGATLPLGASISGRVTDAANPTQGIAGINVNIYDGTGQYIPNIWGANTDNAGNYTIGGLPDGNYKVCFYSGNTSYIGECYDNLPLDPANATTISITGGSNVTGKDASLNLGATINGRVTFNSAGVMNVSVQLRDSVGNWVPNVSQGVSNANGDYTIRGIPAGTYKVYFDTWSTPDYLAQWYDNKYSSEQATLLSLTVGETRNGVNAALTQKGAITGQLRDSSNQPLSYVSVNLWDVANNDWKATTYTDMNGTYTFNDLPAGSYKIQFNPMSYYESKWYPNATDMAGATSVTVAPPATTTVPTVTLARFYDLSVNNWPSGGSGIVSDNLGKISCGLDCYDTYSEGTVVTLTAVPDSNSVFTGWEGACSGTGTCQVTMDQYKYVSATFALRQYTLDVTKSGTGSGTVSDSYLRIYCGSDCNDTYQSGTVVTLYANPDPNSSFAGWSGACTGTGECTVSLDGNKSVTATFTDASTVKIDGIGYMNLYAAYSAVATGGIIQARALDFMESLTLDRNVAVTLKGGYDSVFLANSSFTQLRGVLTVAQGALTVDRVIIQ